MCETWKSHHFLFACTKFVCLLVDDAKIVDKSSTTKNNSRYFIYLYML